MTYQFVRMQDDGRIASFTPHRQFKTIPEAKAAAPDLLSGRKGGGKIVLIQVLEEAITTSNVRYETFGKGIQKEKL